MMRLAWVFPLFILVILSGCSLFGNDDNGPVLPDELLVSSHTPNVGAVDVAVSSAISVTFNIDIDSSTINSSTFVVTDNLSNSVAGNFSFTARSVTFTPSSSLSLLTTYHVLLGASIGSLSGALLTSDYSWSFTTQADTQAPTIPTGLSLTAISPRQMDVDWADSSDDFGTVTYLVYKDSNFVTEVTNSFYSDTTLLPGLSHCYVVYAKDNVGNISAASSSVCDQTAWDITVLTGAPSYSMGGYIGMTLTATGNPVVSYQSANAALGYSYFDGASWNSDILNPGAVSYTDVVVDSAGYIHMVFYEWLNQDLMYYTNSSGSWVLSTIDSAGDVGAEPSVAIDSNDKLHVSYYDGTNGDLKYATNVTGSWVVATIDSTNTTGRHSSIAIDSNDYVHIYFLNF